MIHSISVIQWIMLLLRRFVVLCLVKLLFLLDLSVKADAPLTGAVKEINAAELTRFRSLFTYDRGMGLETLSEDHWLILWLKKALAGKMIGCPISLVEKPSNWAARAASSWKRGKPYPINGKQSVSSPRSSGQPVTGIIWLDSGPSRQDTANENFVEMWYTLFFEIGNLMAVERLDRLWEQAVKGEISELRYTVLAVSIEIESTRIACQLCRGLILPLIGENRVPLDSSWREWEKIHATDPLQPKNFWALFPDHFEYYRKAYRKARAQRPNEETGGLRMPP